MGQLVVSCRNAPEVLQPIERVFDPPTHLVQAFVKCERLLPVAAVRDDRFGPALGQLLAQLGAVIVLSPSKRSGGFTLRIRRSAAVERVAEKISVSHRVKPISDTEANAARNTGLCLRPCPHPLHRR